MRQNWSIVSIAKLLLVMMVCCAIVQLSATREARWRTIRYIDGLLRHNLKGEIEAIYTASLRGVRFRWEFDWGHLIDYFPA
ncbi:DUF3568 family protein [Salmonella enterica subsp. enterica]|nr:DUF3568 family protein [Salmonella enterica subsp. enterica]